MRGPVPALPGTRHLLLFPETRARDPPITDADHPAPALSLGRDLSQSGSFVRFMEMRIFRASVLMAELRAF